MPTGRRAVGIGLLFFTPSATARNQLFYFTSIGHFSAITDIGWSVRTTGNYLLLYVKKGKLSVTTEGEVSCKGRRYGIHQLSSAA